MSQHRFRADGHDVVTGWDRALQRFHLTVTAIGNARPVYCSQYDRATMRGGLSLGDVFTRLKLLRITPPPTLRAELVEDWRHDVGHRIVTYGAEPEDHDTKNSHSSDAVSRDGKARTA